jgi:hypothetical protein
MGISIDLPLSAKPAVQRRLVVIADCENDTRSVDESLRFVGLIGKNGSLKAKAQGIQIVQTGDLLHKNAPSPAVVRYWEGLRSAGSAGNCTLQLVAGNHELDIWRRLLSGDRLGLKRRYQRSVLDLIRTTRLFHVEGSILFIHGYPTVKLLRHIQAYLIGTGKDINDYNEDCFRPALDNPELLARYAYPRRSACRGGCLLHDLANPPRYYRRHGREVAVLLAAFGIDLVVHGHRPERSGVQTDFELQRWLPGIRMISHDIQLRLQGLGATLIRQVETGPTDLLFVNRKCSKPNHRAEARRLLQAPRNPAWAEQHLGTSGLDGQRACFAKDRNLTAPGILSATPAAA